MLALFPPKASAQNRMWQKYTLDHSAGSRPYFVYSPANYQVGTVVPLVVMLHGCTQTAQEFAAGTQMNMLADQYNFIVVYPQQENAYNQYLCWNWFDSTNQSRGNGEPAIIARIIQAILFDSSQWTIDRRRIYVAGLSAGAAMSVIMGATYPDIFAAIGVHSGLEYQAATARNKVLKVSRRGGPDPLLQGQAAYDAMDSYARVIPTITFHGSSDYVINPINGNQVVQQWMQTDLLASNGVYQADFSSPSSTRVEQVANGRSYTVYSWNDNNGHELQEYWKIDGMGHAWSGGNYSGTYVDPLGPNASLAMYTFFMNHPMPRPSIHEIIGHDGAFWRNLRKTLSGIFHASSIR